MSGDFLDRVRSSTAEESLFLHTGNFGSMLELKDGSLLNLSGMGRSLSSAKLFTSLKSRLDTV